MSHSKADQWCDQMDRDRDTAAKIKNLETENERMFKALYDVRAWDSIYEALPDDLARKVALALTGGQR